MTQSTEGTDVGAIQSAEGIDVSAFQLDLTVHELGGLAFAFTKATDGLSITDPNFTHNWAMIRHAGLHRGTYHELQSGHPALQAAHFLSVVRAQGIEAGDMLAVVASDYPGVTDADVLTFCDEVKGATRGLNPVLAYTDLSVGATLARTSAAGYPLWVAWPPSLPGAAPPMPLANWRTWKAWQWGTRLIPGLGHVDANGYNGTPADMGAWIASFKPKPPPPAPSPLAQGDDMFILPADLAEVALTAPDWVLGRTGPVTPSELKLSAQYTVALEYNFTSSDPWTPLPLSFDTSPFRLPLAGHEAVKIRRVPGDKSAIPVTGVFA